VKIENLWKLGYNKNYNNYFGTTDFVVMKRCVVEGCSTCLCRILNPLLREVGTRH